jgi:hypothetical protein
MTIFSPEDGYGASALADALRGLEYARACAAAPAKTPGLREARSVTLDGYIERARRALARLVAPDIHAIDREIAEDDHAFGRPLGGRHE